jgi:DNA-binding HxlR family transcriptional regulator
LVQRTSLEADHCPIARSLDDIGDWWALLIVRDAFHGLRRFGEFQRSLGLAKNILSARLRKLVERKILELVPARDGSSYQEYVLTQKGEGLFNALVALRQWGVDHLYDRGDAPRSDLVDIETGKQVKKLELRAKDGRLLRPEDTRLKARRVPRGVKPEVAGRRLVVTR